MSLIGRKHKNSSIRDVTKRGKVNITTQNPEIRKMKGKVVELGPKLRKTLPYTPCTLYDREHLYSSE